MLAAQWQACLDYDSTELLPKIQVPIHAVAFSQDEGIVNLFVPESYRGDWEHFAGVAMHLYIASSPEFALIKGRQLAEEAVKDGAPLADISYCWEGLGVEALPAIVPLMTHEKPDVAFFAARAAAFLGEPIAMESNVSDEVFNVGTGQQTSLNDLCAAVLRATLSEMEPEYREARTVANVRSRKAATEKAEKMLGFRYAVPLQEGLCKLIEWRCGQKSTPAVVSELPLALGSRA